MRLGLIGGDVNNTSNSGSVSGIFTPEERVAYEKSVGNIQYYAYNSKSKLISGQEGAAQDLFFSVDGTKAYIIGTGNLTIYQYTLSTPWDVSTLTYASKSLAISSTFGDATPYAFYITRDGINLFVLGITQDKVFYFRLTTPWDISTAIQPNVYNALLQVASGSATGVKFSSDGTKMYVISSSTNEVVYQYTLSTAWDINTASYASKSLTITTQDGAMNDIAFSSDGTKMYAPGDTNNTIYQYTLSTAWDISTGTYASKSLAVGTQDTTPSGFVFSSDGTKGYMVGSTNNVVYQYTFSVAWDISTGTYASKSFSVATQALTPNAICFKSDGTILYVIDDNTNTIYQYTLGTAWDISTASYASKSITTYSHSYYYEVTPHGLDISSDGTKIYFVGQSNGVSGQSKVFSYDLNTPWDLSTANTYVSPSVAAQDSGMLGIQFKPDGTKMYALGGSGTSIIYQYSLTFPWNLTSLTYSSVSLNVSGQDTAMSGFCFNRNGTKIITCGAINDKIYQYNLTTPWDVSTASFIRSIDISSLETASVAVVFSNDGNKIYFVGSTTDTIYQYDFIFI